MPKRAETLSLLVDRY